MFPLYYIPPGVVPPKHIAGLHASIYPLRPGIAPLGVPEEEATKPHPELPGQNIGGHLVGSNLSEDIKHLFQKTRDGWYLALGNIGPHSLARVRGVGGKIIPGIEAGHEWCVPTLLHLSKSDGRLTSAIPAIYKNYQWQSPEQFHGVIDRLGSYLRAPENPPIQEATELSVEILAINYHISIHELSAAGWLSETLVCEIIRASIDFSG